MSINQLAKKITEKFNKTFYVDKYKKLLQQLDDLHEKQCRVLEAQGVTEVPVKVESTPIQEYDISWRAFVNDHRRWPSSNRTELHLERNCVQLPLTNSGAEIDFFLRQGVRCFFLDLFIGTCEHNQELLMLLRTHEMKLSLETGTAVRSNVLARIHPRLKLTGMLFSEQTFCSLHTGRALLLTCDRSVSTFTNANHIYVNAANILPKLKMFDNIYISNHIKLVVMLVEERRVECRVVRGGLLRSRMSVVFPPHIDVHALSPEEMEDIVFCKEMKINYVFSYASENVKLLRELKNVFSELEYTQIKFGACVSLNGFKGTFQDLVWMADNNDAYLMYIDPVPPSETSDIVEMSLAVRLFMHRIHAMHKPVILDPSPIAAENLKVHQKNSYFLCYLPDRYLMHRSNLPNIINFDNLQVRVFEPMTSKYLMKPQGHTPATDLTLARSITQASLDSRARLILLAYKNKTLVQSLAHTRPKALIVAVLPDIEESESVFVNWNVISLPYLTSEEQPFNQHIYEKLLYGLTCAYRSKMIKNMDIMVVVFERETDVLGEFKGEFHEVRFNEKLYPMQLLKLMCEKEFNISAVKAT